MVGCQAGGGQADLRGQGDGVASRAALGQDLGRAPSQFRAQVGSRQQAVGEEGGGLGEGEREVIQGPGELVGISLT
ncbi:hypothetical protein GCM10010448_23600 [Streptomyces glomeratus]|uniref:Uncharacterized protein n=1 Tax=Streptomyces glomeratus TaxID=284452 RepID=A0ABP6LIG0_9ACTN